MGEKRTIVEQITDRFVEENMKIIQYRGKTILLTKASYPLFVAGNKIYNDAKELLSRYHILENADEDMADLSKKTKKELIYFIEKYQQEIINIDEKLNELIKNYENEVDKQ